ncbi:MAG: hypothetical protein COX79_05320 [Candidatus Levybacteria bacterium CG_4_10_14_0_2_um_filter_36_16]|nr:MAG: hypothetical protein AUK12_00440 [Candidatus Levybacteria bacterium CG2_30_37_29]PIZ96371.1 MAG: hypothetical protein COX79_05320 [Candidatus Levybacteria bacterium CG_4_10_14_0_2_um_filter_36_16]PJA90349.1 MAG: hypothetical protein CO136_02470 [Candidatus Levybacteria bacterium CG_4_9_14_3_um_filter_36_7]
MGRKLLLWGWIIGALLLLLYSFTQIDLSLTFSQISIWQVFQKQFQYIGYFNRPLSTVFYIFLIVISSSLYVLTLREVIKNKLNRKTVWTIIFAVAAILFFSYNAFSYDFFNYMFDARVVTHYHLNPYLYKALDFPGDPMLSFMRSTHRVYPYGPSWLLFTVPLSFIGVKLFILTFYLFKLLVVASTVLAAFMIEKIARILKLKNPLFPVVFFALNPLVLFEAFVSGHNDMVMVSLVLVSFYLLFKQKYVGSILFLLLSIGVKFATIIFIPLYLLIIFKKSSNTFIVNSLAFLAAVGVVITSLASGQNKNPEFQPWYLLLFLPFVSLLESKKIILFVTVFITIASLLSYFPFIADGHWPKNIVELKNIILLVSALSGVVVYSLSKKLSDV